MNRREFCSVLGAGSLVSASIKAEREAMRVETFTFKQVGRLGIKADVHRSDDSMPRPVAVWIHGGALINGHRASIDGRVRPMMLDAGYVLVSIDYRLAPETKLPAIIQDVEDAFAWVHKEGPKLFHADPRRIVVLGGSAGGYLTLTAGFRVRPRPTALVSFWGYGDLVGDWYSTPSPHPRHHRTSLSAEEAFQQVSGPPISDSRERKGNGGAFYEPRARSRARTDRRPRRRARIGGGRGGRDRRGIRPCLGFCKSSVTLGARCGDLSPPF